MMISQFIKGIKTTWTRIMLLGAIWCGSTACEPIFDSEGDCQPHYFVRFVYDMNMLYTDAFHTQVESVDLYVFDAETGQFVKHFDAQGETLRQPGYRMAVDLEPGDYEFVAWCGLADNEDHFTVPQRITAREDLQCKMARSYDEESGAPYSRLDLHALFHGKATASLPDEQGEHTVTVKLVKDVNNITLTMMQRTGALNTDRFAIVMTEENGFMHYDNSLLSDEPIEFRPWTQRTGLAGIHSQTRAEAGEVEETQPFLQAEISTGRLMADRRDNVIYQVIDTRYNQEVFHLDIIKTLLDLRSQHYKNMDEQEYLDREDQYDIVVILGDMNDAWTAVSIVINGWAVKDMGDQNI